ncbi:MAG: lytic transglycosylase domain-containing protein [Bacteroidales bacterium]|nr:lytic transglycosylase domain-containing protein [Bacteroidales bacterium]
MSTNAAKFLFGIIITLSAILPSGKASAQVSPRVPASIKFADEVIDLTRQDLYERMDRELISFTYSHASTLLALKKQGKYFPIIEPILKEYGIPDDLKYLAVVETNLEPTLVSPVGAAGLWQFMVATGKQYGLEVRDEVDERFHVEKETVAACKFIKDAYAKFGDWMTVAASYNAGMGGISRKLSEQCQSCALDLWLSTETSRYMLRLLAAKMLFEHPEAFGYNIVPADYYRPIPIAETVMVEDDVPSLINFALEHGCTYAALKRANPWLRDSKITNPKKKKYYIAIPK